MVLWSLSPVLRAGVKRTGTDFYGLLRIPAAELSAAAIRIDTRRFCKSSVACYCKSGVIWSDLSDKSDGSDRTVLTVQPLLNTAFPKQHTVVAGNSPCWKTGVGFEKSCKQIFFLFFSFLYLTFTSYKCNF